MSVERRTTKAGLRYVVRWREEGTRRARHFDRYRDALAFDTAMRNELRERRQLGGFARSVASEMRLGDYIEKAWSERAIGWEENTREVRAAVIDTWIDPLLGKVPLRECSKARIRKYRTQMIAEGVPRRDGVRGRRKASNNTVNAASRILSAFLGFAVDDGLLPENPCLGIRSLPHQSSKHQAWDPTIVERLRAQMRHRDRMVVSLMYLAGLRPQEALALCWRHVGERVLLIEQAAAKGKVKTTKTASASTVPIFAPLAADLAAWREEETARVGGDLNPKQLLIPAQRGDAPLHLSQWRQHIWHGARRRAELPDMTPYDMRHTFGSLLIHEGRDVLEVARMMRHADATTTLDHYAHEFDEWRERPKRTLVEVVMQARQELAGDERPDDQGGGHVEPAQDPPPGSPGSGESFEPDTARRRHGSPSSSPALSEARAIDDQGTEGTAGLAAAPAVERGVGVGTGALAPAPQAATTSAAPATRDPRTASPAAGPGSSETAPPRGTHSDHTDAEGAPDGDPLDPRNDADSALHHPAAHAHAAHDCGNGTEDYGSPVVLGHPAPSSAAGMTPDDPSPAGPGPKKDPRRGRFTIIAAAVGEAPLEVFSHHDEGVRDHYLGELRAAYPEVVYAGDTPTAAGDYELVDELLAPARRERERREVPDHLIRTHLRDNARGVWMLAGAR